MCNGMDLIWNPYIIGLFHFVELTAIFNHEVLFLDIGLVFLYRILVFCSRIVQRRNFVRGRDERKVDRFSRHFSEGAKLVAKQDVVLTVAVKTKKL
jgi:hypothetical protein